jgi:membrane-associated phospholipid phosphatase
VLVVLLGWSRVTVEDHSVAQVAAGTVLGAGAAALAYAVLVSLTPGTGTGAPTGK